MTLNELRALSEVDTIKFPMTALEQIMLCPKGADDRPVGYLGNQTDCTPSRSHRKTKQMRQMQWRLSCLTSR